MQTLPKIGDLATVAGISFPLTVESYDYNTLLANLKGKHPETGMEVVVPLVCLSLLHTGPTLFIGQLAVLNSGGPWLTVAEIWAPSPEAPVGSAWTVDCICFSEDGQLTRLYGLDVRALTFKKAA
jgi:hypothetical protein